jgi:hypothetical protein
MNDSRLVELLESKREANAMAMPNHRSQRLLT